jgi:hypothetical protein
MSESLPVNLEYVAMDFAMAVESNQNGDPEIIYSREVAVKGNNRTISDSYLLFARNEGGEVRSDINVDGKGICTVCTARISGFCTRWVFDEGCIINILESDHIDQSDCLRSASLIKQEI